MSDTRVREPYLAELEAEQRQATTAALAQTGRYSF